MCYKCGKREILQQKVSFIRFRYKDWSKKVLIQGVSRNVFARLQLLTRNTRMAKCKSPKPVNDLLPSPLTYILVLYEYFDLCVC